MKFALFGDSSNSEINRDLVQRWHSDSYHPPWDTLSTRFLHLLMSRVKAKAVLVSSSPNTSDLDYFALLIKNYARIRETSILLLLSQYLMSPRSSARREMAEMDGVSITITGEKDGR